jgi:hypothetical protein
MAKKLPVDFEKKVKEPPPADGRGYPYQLSAKDLMLNFRAISEYIPDGTSKGDILYWTGMKWDIHPAATGDGLKVLTMTSGVLSWTDTDDCE